MQTSFYFLKERNIWWKEVVCSLVSIYVDRTQLKNNKIINKKNLYKTLDYWFKDMLSFNSSEKCPGLVSLPHFVYDFSRKLFLLLHSINWPNIIVWLPLQISGCDLIKFEIKLIFLTKPFRYITKKSRQKHKYLEKEKSFWHEIKRIFYHFWKGFQLSKIVSDLRVRL